MISFGKNIRLPNDSLEKISLRQFNDKIKNPGKNYVDFISQLRAIQSLDPGKYRQWKVKLPYAVAALFRPPFRKKENFAKTNYFILDIDHLSDKQISIENLITRLKNDERIALFFRSPSNDGLKLFFKFKEPLYDTGKYTLFYKLFAQKFASQYGLNQVIDKKTSDISRACFLSYDPQSFFREDSWGIDVSQYINFENQLEVTRIERQIQQYEKENRPDKKKQKAKKQALLCG